MVLLKKQALDFHLCVHYKKAFEPAEAILIQTQMQHLIV